MREGDNQPIHLTQLEWFAARADQRPPVLEGRAKFVPLRDHEIYFDGSCGGEFGDGSCGTEAL